jgi:replication factor A1
MSLNVNDHTGQLWLNCFDDQGRAVMGMSANDLMELKENDSTAMEKAFEDANCKTWIFKCRAKMDNFQDQARYVLQWEGQESTTDTFNASPINFAMEANKLADLIKQYNLE